MGRPFTNMKNYEKRIRGLKHYKELGLSKLEFYLKILKSIQKEGKKAREKAERSSKQHDVLVELIFEEKEKLTKRIKPSK